MSFNPLVAWHELVKHQNSAGLDAMLAEKVVFYSPVLFSPQIGRPLTTMYLSAAVNVFFNNSFHYVKEIVGESSAMLEFEVDLDGIVANGVDIISWNKEGLIVEFNVMIRPYRAIDEVKKRMLKELQP